MNALIRKIDNSPLSIFDEFFSPARFFNSETSFSPAIDVIEDEKNFEIVAEIPGIDNSDISVSIDEDVLSIRGEKKFVDEKNEKNCHRIERKYGTFERRIRLPRGTNLENIDAHYENGLLKISIPKEEVKTHKIEIKTSK